MIGKIRIKLFFWMLPVLVVAILASLFIPVGGLTITSTGRLSLTIGTVQLQANSAPLDVSITDIKAYAQLEISGSILHNDNIRLRFDMFLESDAPGYNIHHIQVPIIPPEGYPGEVDKDGNPIDIEDYDKWLEGLPREWQNNPFLCAFTHISTDTTDEQIKQKMVDILEQSYKHWVKYGNLEDISRSLVGFLDGSVTDEKSLGQKKSRLTDITNRASEFSVGGSIILTVSTGSNIVYANPDVIDIGGLAIDRGSLYMYGYTYVAVDNPANGTGTITAVEIWAKATALEGCKAGTFSGSGTSYTNRDYHTIGDVVAGSKQTFSGLDIDVTTGDYIGAYYTAGSIEADTVGYAGLYYKSGDQFGAGIQTYTLLAGDAMSVYGTGEAVAACSEDISNHPASKDFGSVSTSSSYTTGLAFFDVENNSGGTIDISIQATNMTGGTQWTLNDTATPGADIYGLKAGLSGGDYTIIVKLNPPYNNLVTGLVDSVTQGWGLKLYAPTSFGDYLEKTGIVTISATCQ